MNLSSNRSMALTALYAGVIIMAAGMIIAPMGIIDSSVLYGTGQLFILCATLAGCGEAIGKILSILHPERNIKEEEKK